MSKLNAAERKEIPKSEFGLPGSRKYPMPDRSHAAEDGKMMTHISKTLKRLQARLRERG